jgi:hypothetical protein
VIRPDHCVWAIILTPPFEPIDLKKMEGRSLSLGLGLQYNIFVVQRYVWYLIFYLEEPISSGYPAHIGLTWRNQFLLVTQPT